MRVTNFRKTVSQKITIYKADFIFDNNDLNGVVVFKVPASYGNPNFYYDPFFVAAAPMAMALEENLNFEGDVSAKLSANIYAIKKHINQAFSRIKIRTRKVVTYKKNGHENGLFFTLGVDSFHSLLCSSKKISKLVFVHGFLSYKVSKSVKKEVEEKIRKVAKSTKTEAVFIETNLRDIADKIISWDYYHGAAIAASALFLTSKISRMYISNCEEYLIDKPWGTKKELDHLWSTDRMSFESIFPYKIRMEKAIDLVKNSRSLPLLKNLWVCYRHISDTRIENCSNCAKCMRTYLCFLAAGMKEPIPGFKKLNPRWLYQMEIKFPEYKKWERILNSLIKKRLGNEAIYQGIRDVIRRKKKFAFAKWRQQTSESFKSLIKKILKRTPLSSLYTDLRYIFAK